MAARSRFGPLLLLSIAIHIAAGLIAGVVIVVRRLSPGSASAPPIAKSVIIPRAEEHTEAASTSYEGSSVNGAIQSVAISKAIQDLAFSIPPAPASRTEGHASMSASLVQSSLGPAGLGIGLGLIGMGDGGGGKSEKSAPSFLGVKTPGERIVLMFDISKTVSTAAAKAGMPMERIREETRRLIESLGVNTRFNLVQFARNYVFFRPTLAAASRSNRDAAQQWLTRFFGTQGTLPSGIPSTVTGSPGFLAALSEVFKLEPDSIVIISDGDMQRGTSVNSTISIKEIESTIAQLQAGRTIGTRIQFIGVGVKKATADGLKQILARHGSGGTYTELRN
jgi:hypothetical protein